jgi:hypothetical protein
MLELARTPARVTGEHAQPVEQRKQVVGFAVEIDRADEPSKRGPARQRTNTTWAIGAVAANATEAHHGVGSDGASDVDHSRLAYEVGPTGQPWERDGVPGGDLTRPVEDDAECSFVVVVEEEDNAAREVRIREGRRRDEKRAGE